MDDSTSQPTQQVAPPPVPPPSSPVADVNQIDDMIAQLQAAKDAMHIAQPTQGGQVTQTPPPMVGTKVKENIVTSAPVAQVYEQQSHDPVVADKIAKEEGDEYWENYAREIELEKEILEMGGIEKVESGEVKLPENLAKEMGVAPVVNVNTPIAQTTDVFKVAGISLTDDQVGAGTAKPVSTGFRWLVEWFIYQLRKAHYIVKKVHGKITRQKQ